MEPEAAVEAIPGISTGRRWSHKECRRGFDDMLPWGEKDESEGMRRGDNPIKDVRFTVTQNLVPCLH